VVLGSITSNAPLVRGRLEGAATVLKHTRHVLSTIVNEAEARHRELRCGMGLPGAGASKSASANKSAGAFRCADIRRV
jgi:hypothetical protein